MLISSSGSKTFLNTLIYLPYCFLIISKAACALIEADFFMVSIRSGCISSESIWKHGYAAIKYSDGDKSIVKGKILSRDLNSTSARCQLSSGSPSARPFSYSRKYLPDSREPILRVRPRPLGRFQLPLCSTFGARFPFWNPPMPSIMFPQSTLIRFPSKSS